MGVYYGFILINLLIIVGGCIYDYFYEEDGLVITPNLIFWIVVFILSSFIGTSLFILVYTIGKMYEYAEEHGNKVVFKFKKEKK